MFCPVWSWSYVGCLSDRCFVLFGPGAMLTGVWSCSFVGCLSDSCFVLFGPVVMLTVLQVFCPVWSCSYVDCLSDRCFVLFDPEVWGTCSYVDCLSDSGFFLSGLILMYGVPVVMLIVYLTGVLSCLIPRYG